MSSKLRHRHRHRLHPRAASPSCSDPFSVMFGLIQPLFFLALFAPLLSSVSRTRHRRRSLQWFVPGTIVMLCLFGTSTTGANLLSEMQTGSHERMLVTPLSRSSLMIGRALKEIVPTAAQACTHRGGHDPVRLPLQRRSGR